VEGSRVLDLFAGTGALGLEALSRNARLAVFVDFSPLSLKLINKNIQLCMTGFPAGCTVQVIKHDLTRNLPISKLPREMLAGFDLIFMDPPYGKNISLSTLDFLNRSSLLAPNGLLVVEERHNVELPQKFSTFDCRDKRIYGETSFYFYQRSNRI
jgi:16S rRNA (guanine966-N2)-methyltransferase